MALSEEAKVKLTIEARNGTGKALGEVDRALGGLKTRALQLAAALGSALAIRSIVRDTRQWADELGILTQQLGLSAEQAGELNAISRILGIQTADLAAAIGGVTRRMSAALTATDQSKTGFGRWGISVRNADGTTRSFLDVLDDVRKRYHEVGDAQSRNILINDTVGRSSQRIADLSALDSEEYERLGARVRNLARLMGGEGVARMEQMTRAQNSLSLGLTGLKIAAGVPLFEALDGLVNRLADLAFEWMPRVQDAVRGVIGAFQVVWSFVTSVAMTFGTLIRRIAEATGVMRFFAGIGKTVGEVIRGFLGLLKQATDELNKFRQELDEGGVAGALRKLDELADPLRISLEAIAIALGLLVAKAVLDGLAKLTLAMARLVVTAAPLILISAALALLVESAKGGDDAFRDFAAAVLLATAAIALQFRVQIAKLAGYMATTLIPTIRTATARVAAFTGALLAAAAAQIATGIAAIGTAVANAGSAALTAATRGSLRAGSCGPDRVGPSSESAKVVRTSSSRRSRACAGTAAR